MQQGDYNVSMGPFAFIAADQMITLLPGCGAFQRRRAIFKATRPDLDEFAEADDTIDEVPSFNIDKTPSFHRATISRRSSI